MNALPILRNGSLLRAPKPGLPPIKPLILCSGIRKGKFLDERWDLRWHFLAYGQNGRGPKLKTYLPTPPFTRLS